VVRLRILSAPFAKWHGHLERVDDMFSLRDVSNLQMQVWEAESALTPRIALPTARSGFFFELS